MKICGVEEAGRGPVIGPLVMCGLVIDDSKEALLRKMGAKDSKMLTRIQREKLFDRILQISDAHKIVLLSPEQIDKAVQSQTDNLNWLEAENSAQIINELKPEKAFIDCPSPNIKAYTKRLQTMIKGVELIVEHKADVKYPVVSAASIIAKVTRDNEIEKLKAAIGIDFGSGYPSDPMTQEFLKKYIDDYPHIFRKSWMPYKNGQNAKKQKTLGEF